MNRSAVRLYFLTCALLPASKSWAAFFPGDVAIARGGGGAEIAPATPSQANNQLFNHFGGSVYGVAFTPDGDLVGASDAGSSSGFDIFAPDGSLVTGVLTPAVDSASAIAALSNGNFVISGEGTSIYTRAGTLVKTISQAGTLKPVAASDGTFWAYSFGDFLHFTNDGASLPTVSPPDGGGGNFVVDPRDGSFWISSSNSNLIIYHEAADGTLLNQFNEGGPGGAIAQGPDGNLYIDNEDRGVVDEFTTTGTFVRLLDVDYASSGAPSAIAVFPGVPEPLVTPILTAIASFGLLRRRRRGG